MYSYQAKILKVIDGDTVQAEVDLGFHIKMTMNLRLLGINTPEMNSKIAAEVKAAREAKDFLVGIVLNKVVSVLTVKDRTEKYGRMLATIIFEGQNINQLLINGGHAKPL